MYMLQLLTVCGDISGGRWTVCRSTERILRIRRRTSV